MDANRYKVGEQNMPRTRREKSRSGIYHIMLRGINQQTIFEDVEDKSQFLYTLKKYKEVSNYELYGYCLMDNHVHLLLRETEEPLSLSIKRISSSYVYWYNEKYNRCGHLFQERFKSEKVENSRYFLTALRYIHQNPLKAGIVKSIFDSDWTSLNEYIVKEKLVDTELALSQFATNRKAAMDLFLQYMIEENNDKCLEYEVIVKPTDDEVREYLKNLGVESSSSLQKMATAKRNEILSKLKKHKGVSLRQASRITGISKSLIQRIK